MSIGVKKKISTSSLTLPHLKDVVEILGGHHLYMNLCLCVCLSVRPCVCNQKCAFLSPPQVTGTPGH